jgi:monofunctional biosynthetic peptidoglycan transglycosylase
MKWSWRWRAAAVVLLVVLLPVLWVVAHLAWWSFYNPTSTAFMERRLAALREANANAKLQYKWVPYARISADLKRAVIAAEDAKFLDHEGFDWEGIREAYEKNQRRGKIVAGGSTISQQLAKNLFLSGERSAVRKVEEAVITVLLEAILSKRRIFEIYLNVIEWGEGVFGVEAAALHYFGVPAARLNAQQAARLAAMVPRPRFYDRKRDTPVLDRRMEIILSRMQDADVP